MADNNLSADEVARAREIAAPPQQISVPGGYRPLLLGRDVSIYPMAETELDQLTSTNGKATFWWSVATLFYGVGASAGLSGLALTGERTAVQVAAFSIVPWLCGAFALAATVAAAMETRQRRSMLARLKRDSRIPASLSAVTSDRAS